MVAAPPGRTTEDGKIKKVTMALARSHSLWSERMRMIVSKSDLNLLQKHVVDLLDPELEDIVENAAPKGGKYELTFE